MTRRYPIIAVSVVLLALAAACGGGFGGSDQSGATLSISDPKDGSSTAVPFTVTVESSAPLGDTGTGKHHVHIWFDGHSDKYVIGYTNQVKITDLSPGQHTMTVSLRNPNHSEAGVDKTMTITVSGGSPAPSPSNAPSSGYGY
jgi:hypothetical protein